MPTTYKFTCKKCGFVWLAARISGNTKCPKCGCVAFPHEVK